MNSARVLKRTLGRGRLHLDIVNYPGEWLLDLALLRKSYAAWSAPALFCHQQARLTGDFKASSLTHKSIFANSALSPRLRL